MHEKDLVLKFEGSLPVSEIEECIDGLDEILMNNNWNFFSKSATADTHNRVYVRMDEAEQLGIASIAGRANGRYAWIVLLVTAGTAENMSKIREPLEQEVGSYFDQYKIPVNFLNESSEI